MDAIFAALSISTVAATVSTFLVAGIGVRLLYKGYSLAKTALGRI